MHGGMWRALGNWIPFVYSYLRVGAKLIGGATLSNCVPYINVRECCPRGWNMCLSHLRYTVTLAW